MFCIYGNLAILSNLALLYESTYWSFTSLRMIHFYLKFSKAPHRGRGGNPPFHTFPPARSLCSLAIDVFPLVNFF